MAVSKQSIRDESSFFFEHDLHFPTRTYQPRDTEIDSGYLDKLSKALLLLENVSGEPIHIILNCEGGDVTQGLAIYDRIKASPCHVTITVLGECSSMTTVILQAGDRRRIYKNSVMMYHDGTAEYPKGHKNAIKAWQRVNDIQDRECNRILYERMKEADPKLTLKKLESSQTHDVVLTAHEALQKGLVDEIIP